jgi:hypothetical protein
LRKSLKINNLKIRATDAKEVGVKDPAEETFCHPNRNLTKNFIPDLALVNSTPWLEVWILSVLDVITEVLEGFCEGQISG